MAEMFEQASAEEIDAAFGEADAEPPQDDPSPEAETAPPPMPSQLSITEAPIAPIQLREVSTGDSSFSNLTDPGKFEQLQRVAKVYAHCALVPQHYRGKLADCIIACQMAMRLDVDPMMFLQNTYVVSGRPGMEAKLVIALVNSSGLFRDPLDYEVEGDNPAKDGYRVRCVAVRKGTGKVVYGPWVDWAMVKAEKWNGRTGSKWLTMPDLMFRYRAAAFFARLNCPERLMGMQTVDELEDVHDRRVVPNEAAQPQSSAEVLRSKLATGGKQ